FNAEQEIARLTSRVKLRKEEAKDLREDGDITGAIETLTEAVAALTASPLHENLELAIDATAPQRALAGHLADCLGMIGGNYRRLNRLEEALVAFERGRTYEEAERFQLTSSYNMVNAITLPLEMRSRTTEQQHDALERAVAAINRQVKGPRRGDRWAWADLGQCQLVLGDLESAEKSYKRVRDLGDDDTLRSLVAVRRR